MYLKLLRHNNIIKNQMTTQIYIPLNLYFFKNLKIVFPNKSTKPVFFLCLSNGQK